jgi:type VI protein secretion system component VasK
MENSTATPAAAAPAAPVAPVAPVAPAAPVMAHGGSVHDAAPQMIEGGDVASIENSWGTWIAIGLVSLTLVALILQIAVHRKNLKKVDADDEALLKDVRELKMNVKKQMGEKYETLA